MSRLIDHAVIAVQHLDAAVQDYRDLGFIVVPGGIHANRATQNALIIFADGSYLELLAATGEPPLPGLIDFSVLLDNGEGLVAFALRSDDLTAEAARLRVNGLAVGDVIPGERRRTDGIVIRWKLALLDGGFAPFLIQDVTPRGWRVPTDPAFSAHPNRAMGIQEIQIAARDIALGGDRYTKLFGTQPPPTSTTQHSIGCVVLHEDPAAGPREALAAVYLKFEHDAGCSFRLEQTHGVRFLVEGEKGEGRS